MMFSVELHSNQGLKNQSALRCRPACLTAVLVFAVWGAGPSAVRAQDDEVVADVPAGDMAEQQFMVADENFDQWVFGGRGTAVANQKRFEAMLKVQIEGVERTCRLSEDQRKKLTLAGNVDIKRFFGRVAVLKKRFDQIKNDQNKFQEFWQHMQPVQTDMNRGIFGEGSYFRKTLKNLLTSSQVIETENADRERRLFNFRSKVESVVTSLDEVLSLSADQRRKLVGLLTEPKMIPKTMGQDAVCMYAVLYLASQIPDEKLKQVFDVPQFNTVKRILNMTRGYGQYVKTNGFTWDSEPTANDKAGGANLAEPGVIDFAPPLEEAVP
jgi:hypothetical protein